MARLPARIPEFDPEHLDLDARLDLLVDDELPEAARRDVLLSLDNQPQAWRTLATRFLERQTERKAVKQLIDQSCAAAEIPPTYPFRRRTSAWPVIRNVAAVLVVATLAALSGAHFGGSSPSNTGITNNLAEAGSVHVVLPSSVTGDTSGDKTPVDVSVADRDNLPANYPFNNTDQDSNSARHVVIMPLGNDRAVMFPVVASPIEVH